MITSNIYCLHLTSPNTLDAEKYTKYTYIIMSTFAEIQRDQ